MHTPITNTQGRTLQYAYVCLSDEIFGQNKQKYQHQINWLKVVCNAIVCVHACNRNSNSNGNSSDSRVTIKRNNNNNNRKTFGIISVHYIAQLTTMTTTTYIVYGLVCVWAGLGWVVLYLRYSTFIKMTFTFTYSIIKRFILTWNTHSTN